MLGFKDLRNFRVETKDGKRASVKDIYFDDEKFAVRYLILNSGPWKFGKKVLVSPFLVEKVEAASGWIMLKIDREGLGLCPEIDENQPISREMERQYSDRLFLPYYWGGAGLWGLYATPYGTYSPELRQRYEYPLSDIGHGAENHLRSAREVSGYHVNARDERLGHVDDFIIDETDWSIRYFVLHTSDWRTGKSVLVAPDWLDEILWSTKTAYFNVDRSSIEGAPVYDPARPFDKEFETRLYRHYDKPAYWDEKETG